MHYITPSSYKLCCHCDDLMMSACAGRLRGGWAAGRRAASYAVIVAANHTVNSFQTNEWRNVVSKFDLISTFEDSRCRKNSRIILCLKRFCLLLGYASPWRYFPYMFSCFECHRVVVCALVGRLPRALPWNDTKVMKIKWHIMNTRWSSTFR